MNIREKINFLISSCRRSSQIFSHTLLVTEDSSIARKLANDIANGLETDLVTFTSDMLLTPHEVASALTNLKDGDVFFLQEISSLKKTCSNNLMNAIKDFSLDLLIDSGPYAGLTPIKLNRFTLIATTTSMNSLHKKLIGEFFCVIECDQINHLSRDYIVEYFNGNNIYVSEEIAEKVCQLASKRSIDIKILTKNLFQFIILADMSSSTKLTKEIVDLYFEFFGIPETKGLKEYSRQIQSEVKREVWRRDNGQCVICKKNERLEYDHIIPFSKGGSNTVRNIQLLCESCNREKSSNIK